MTVPYQSRCGKKGPSQPHACGTASLEPPEVGLSVTARTVGTLAPARLHGCVCTAAWLLLRCCTAAGLEWVCASSSIHLGPSLFWPRYSVDIRGPPPPRKSLDFILDDLPPPAPEFLPGVAGTAAASGTEALRRAPDAIHTLSCYTDPRLIIGDAQSKK
ncbi:hypothetical protein N7532_000720 [Penicillium argentinense]|uniref:Uncharacterized protein n=1 Tax=Penicillium argentinense TaxID=1131581 RepID=A0A9W9G5T5_9EURO|nr:uncharacterized protein N7532_000720 [Penicillium argentinense]KAJ5112675.1 hypothetical protein N7532_000720 [Penicillium argentinense]